MRAVVQRVLQSKVEVDHKVIGQIGPGLLVLLAAGQGDGPQQVRWMADKIVNLRIFPDEQGLMNLSLLDRAGEMLVVSQFTLYGNCRKGRRPSFIQAQEPTQAAVLVDEFAERVSAQGVSCARGQFGAHMEVSLLNDGPVTLVVDSPDNNSPA